MYRQIKGLTETLLQRGTVTVPLEEFSNLVEILRRSQAAQEAITRLWYAIKGPELAAPNIPPVTIVTTEPDAQQVAQQELHLDVQPDVPARPPEPPQDAPAVRAYVSPPPPPAPLPAAVLDRLGSKFNVRHVSQEPAPPAPAVPEPKPAASASAERFAHFPDGGRGLPPEVAAWMRQGYAPWKAWRLHRDLRPVDVMRAVGLASSARMADLENKWWRIGKPVPADLLEKLAKVLDCKVCELVPLVVRDYPMTDLATLDRQEREYERAERALASAGHHQNHTPKRGTLTLPARPQRTRVDVVGLHARETQEVLRAVKSMGAPLDLRPLDLDAFRRSQPSPHVVVFQKGCPSLNTAPLRAKGVQVRMCNGGVSSLMDILRAIVATVSTEAAAA